MKRYFWGIVFLAGLLAGCAGVPVVPQEGALPKMPFSDIISNVNGYIGKTVVMGGYVLEVENKKDTTQITAVEAPIDSGQRLKSKDLSEGRLILICDGFIDPEVYTKGRSITVNGEILGGGANDPEVPYPYLRIKVHNIHLWPVKQVWQRRAYPEYDPFDWWWYRGYPPYWGYPYYYGYPYSWGYYPYYWYYGGSSQKAYRQKK